MPGRHRKGSYVSRPRKITPIPPQLRRRIVRIAGEPRMTNNRRFENTAEHHQVATLIPWYVNDTLADNERQRVDAHIGKCAVCRDDLAVHTRILEGIVRQPALDY